MGSLAKRGLIDSIPVMISFFFMFSAIGSTYQKNGIPMLESFLGTAFIFAAPLQISGMELIQNGLIYSGILLTIVINFRFILMSFIILEKFPGVERWKIYPSMIMFSASTYAVTTSYVNSIGRNDGKVNFHYYLSVGIPCYVVAVVSTVFGYLASEYINYESLKDTINLIIPINFFLMALKDEKNKLALVSTLSGIVLAPVLNSLGNSLFEISCILVMGAIIYKGYKGISKDAKLVHSKE
ncbi:AzlC family ABC transporter permease [Photobacterium sp. 1_MG-2023]|uniref:AzlC family ABC transporter permease n=1 Tax=Photobacterium sp. 1_MG-2023 TaxID=3062646 RepID=UPI0026E12CCF|nr:AzlC family ABC transporter permease [Photobacterium sp. 1_MG-2023]MDO6709016.1 AzlC family ABC transporter permease [Photobacterium sp. 1_MG-2023]